MKVYFNRKPVTGPWGGGNKTLATLVKKLRESGVLISFDLNDKDIDVIFCMDPRPNSEGIWYNHLLEYKQKNNIKIIQRVGDVGTHSKPELTELLRQVVNFSDTLIFPSEWARQYIDYNKENYHVIYNAAMKNFYKNRNLTRN